MGVRMNHLYDRMRHPEAFRVAEETGAAPDLHALEGHKYCLLVTFRRSGKPVPTPVWFGLANGAAYVNTRQDNLKVTRIRHDPHARVAPCSVRGRPLGPVAEATARLVPDSDRDRAELALRANYGIGRRIYYAMAGRLEETVYIELRPIGNDQPVDKAERLTATRTEPNATSSAGEEGIP